MAVEICIPSWGMTMKQGKITRWLKNEGDRVEKGEALLEIETEKITNVVEAMASGILFQIVVPAGKTAPVKSVVGIIAQEGEKLARMEVGAESAPSCDTGKMSTVVKPTGPVKASPAAKRMAKELGLELSMIHGTGPDGRIIEKDVQQYKEDLEKLPKISPLAKSMADKEGLDISTISGSGSGGKITKADVEAALAGPQQTAAVKEEPVTKTIPYEGMRQAIGSNMLASLQNAAQLTCFAEIDVTEMVRFKDNIQDEYQKDASVKVSFNDIIILAVSRALKHHPIMNSTHEGDQIVLHDNVNMGIAVAVKDGLIVPVLPKANQKGLLEIASGARLLAKKARENSLGMDDISGGTFTISNTSMLEVDGFTPILRPPETAILGVGRLKRKPAEFKGEITLRWMMVLSLTYNHCVVDGVPAHSFLSHVGRYLQNPYLIMS